MAYKSLIMNLGSTSTKIAVYTDLHENFKRSIPHSQNELEKFTDVWEQKEFRKEKILAELAEQGYTLKDFDCICSRGGNVKPVPGGIYELNVDMINDMRSEKYGAHPTNVGNLIAYELGMEYGKPVIMADPPVTDELCEFARFSGVKEIPRMSSFHALNQKRTARKIAQDLGGKYTDYNMIIAHLGGGISVGAHEKGLVIDVNNALDGDGPFSPERAGTVPAGDLIRMCFSGKYNEKDMIKKVRGGGGLMSYLGTNSGLEAEEKIANGDSYALTVYEAMAYHVSKEIAAQAAVLKGKVDVIGLTGSLAYSTRFVNWIKERVEYLAPVYLSPGENEMVSLAENTYRYLSGQEKAKKY